MSYSIPAWSLTNNVGSISLPDIDGTQAQIVPLTGNNCKWNFRVGPLSVITPRLGLTERYGHDGARVSGDRKSPSRQIAIAFDITREVQIGTWRDMAEAQNLLPSFFRDGLGPFYLQDSLSGVRTEVDMVSIDSAPTSEGSLYTAHAGILLLEVLGAYIEDLTATTTADASMADGDTLNVVNSGDEVAYPIITVTALADNSSFRITNNANGIFTELGSAAFLTGEIFVIDSRDGTIYLGAANPVESSVSLADGAGFIQLDPGVNQFQYSSIDGACGVSVVFRRRYPY